MSNNKISTIHLFLRAPLVFLVIGCMLLFSGFMRLFFPTTVSELETFPTTILSGTLLIALGLFLFFYRRKRFLSGVSHQKAKDTVSASATATHLNADRSENTIRTNLSSQVIQVRADDAAMQAVPSIQTPATNTAAHAAPSSQAPATNTAVQEMSQPSTVSGSEGLTYFETLKTDTAPRAVSLTHEQLCFFSPSLVDRRLSRFVAFDVETTGLSSVRDRIIEISAVVFENGKVMDVFSTLVNPGIPISAGASAVNGLHDSDVAGAPNEKTAITMFLDFVGADVLSGDTLLVAHNADFDISFLLAALSRCGLSADLKYVDTLNFSRHFDLPIQNRKLVTLADYFGINLIQAHRASDDAKVCGEICLQLLNLQLSKFQAQFNALTQSDQDICRWFKNIFVLAGLNVDGLMFRTGNYLSVCYLGNTLIRLKTHAKKPYAIISGKIVLPDGLEFAEASKTEGEGFKRVYYSSPADLAPLSDFFILRYQRVCSRFKDLSGQSFKDFDKFIFI